MVLMRFKYLACASALAILGALLAVPASADTLEEAVTAALNYHPRVEAAIANRDAFIEERREQWADYFPTVNVRASGGRAFGDNSTSRGLQVTRDSTYSYIWEGAMTLTQPLFDGFETANRVDAAQARRQSANYNIVDIRENLALGTVAAYMDVLRAEEALSRLKAHGKKIRDYQGRISQMVEQGAADETLLSQARDIEAQLKNTLANLQGQVRKASAQYAELVGKMPEHPMVRPTPRLDILPEDVEQAIEYARRHHPMLQAAYMTEDALLKDAEAEKQFYYPDVNGELSYLKRDQAEEIGGEVVDAKAVLRLNWDISTAGGQFARVRKNLQRHNESKAQRAETERNIVRDIRIASGELQTAKEQMKVLRERVSINEDLFSNYEAQFEGARINLLQLLQSDNALFNARLAMINGEYRILAAQYAVLASIGRLQESMGIVEASARGK